MKNIKLFLVSFVLISCGHNDISKNDKVFLLETDNRKQIHISEDVDIYNRCLKYYEDSEGESFITIDRHESGANSDEIVFYKTQTGKEAFRVPVYKEGPNGINGGLYGHIIESDSTICLSSKYLPILYWINYKGEILKECHFEDDNRLSEFTFLSMFDTPLFYDDGKYVIPQTINSNGECDFEKYPLVYLYNPQNGDVEESGVRFPHIFSTESNRVGQSSTYCSASDGNSYVYSFVRYDSIMVVRAGHKECRMIDAKSRYIDDVKNDGVPMGASVEEQLKKNFEASYGNILYDKWREVYYRFCHFADKEYKGVIQTDYLMCRGEFSIMVLDRDYNVIGETKFERGKYAPKLYFIDKEGLWISENNIERSDMTDDELVFRCLKLEEVK